MPRYIDADAFIKMMEERCDHTASLDELVLKICRGGINAMSTVTINDHPDEIKVTDCNDNADKVSISWGHENGKDAIYRQDAIDALDDIESEVANGFGFQYEKWRKTFADLPSAQPEIVRCEDCKHYKEWESEFTPNAVVTQCMADNFSIRKAIPDGWFCAGAERRTDE